MWPGGPNKLPTFPSWHLWGAFYVRRPRSSCHVERTFSLIDHILTADWLNMTDETLSALAVMYVNKESKARLCSEVYV